VPGDDKDKMPVSSDGEHQEQPTAEATADKKTEASTAQPAEEAVDLQTLQQGLEEQKELVKHHLDQWKRTAADLENYKKRVQKEREELAKFGHAALIRQLLPTLDDFERALQTLPPELDGLTWTKGVGLIAHKLRVVLEQYGLKEIKAFREPFDPMRHEAIVLENHDAYPDGQVIAVLQKGYVLHDRVLRPAMVKVAKNDGGSAAKAPADASATNKQDKAEETAK